MKAACLFFLAWRVGAAGWLEDVRAHGAALEARYQWEQAEALYRSALARFGPGESRQDRFWLLTSLVEVSFERQDYSDSARWLHEAEDSIQSFGEHTPERIRLLTASGALHLVQGNLTAAERDLARAVMIAESVAAPPDLAAALHNLAAVEMQTGQLSDATMHELKALDIWREQFGDRHYYVMKAWISLSSLQGLAGDWKPAAGSIEKALAIEPTREALSNYAVILDKLKRNREAREIRRRLHFETPVESTTPLVDVNAMRYQTGKLGARAQ